MGAGRWGVSEEVLMFYSAAVSYADGAQIILGHQEASRRDGLILPAHTLLGLAIELGYKAVTAHLGADQKALKGPGVRHSLSALRDLARGLGFETAVEGINKIIDVIGDNYGAHEYRYMPVGGTLRHVQDPAAATAVQAFVDEVAVFVGLPVRPEAA